MIMTTATLTAHSAISARRFLKIVSAATMMAVMTVRTPEPLRPKVMTAVMTIANVIGPLGFLAAGFGLQYVSLKVIFLLAAGGFTVGALAFSAAVRNEDTSSAPALAA